ncbi:MAG: type I 3-dehydroquinate dehydratase [Candidatus Thorarchaeota archaeon]
MKKLCVSLTERTAKKCMEFMSSTEADMVEHRLDFMDRIERLEEIYRATEKPIIVTCRSRENGGLFDGNEEQRIRNLLMAMAGGASYVDVEIETDSAHLELVREQTSRMECGLIVSKHYHDSTPNEADLLSMVVSLGSAKPDIIKLVTTPKTKDDCRRILRLYDQENRPNLPLIAFGMGPLGRFTRVCALFLGAPFMYVSQDHGEVAAPGQISLSEMRKILEVLP